MIRRSPSKALHHSISAALTALLLATALSPVNSGAAVRNGTRVKHLPLDHLGQVVMKTRENSFYFHDRVIVKLAPPASEAKSARPLGFSSLQAFAKRYSVESISRVFPETPTPLKPGGSDLSRFYVLKYSSPLDAFTVAKEISDLPEVDYAEPWFIYPTNGAGAFTPNDSLYPLQQWYLTQIRADSAWSVGQGDTSVVIGMVDTGVQWDHPDLAGNIWINPGETGTDARGHDKRFNGIDDDGDGQIDDWHGWDFGGADFNNPVEDNDARPTGDNNAHGTHVSGLASGVTDNHTGIAGVGFHCRILAVKAAADNDTRAGGFAYIIAGFQGIIYAAQMGASVISCSWGGPGASQFEQDVVNIVTQEGSLVVAAAGNGGSADPSYPAGYEHVISVGAVTPADVRESYSNFGSTVDVFAPGGDFSGVNSTILSTYFPSTYQGLAGTSQATPLVSGVAALVKARYPTYSALQVGEQVRVSCDDITALNPSYVNKLGKGRINAYRALTVSLPSLRMTSFAVHDSLGGNNNGVPDPNETVSFVGTFTNYLQPTTTGATVTLSSSDTNIQILSASFSPGIVGMMGVVTNESTPFRFHVGANVPKTYAAVLMLTMSDGAYSDVQFFTVLLNSVYATHDINNVHTTLTNKGNIGFNDFDANTEGVGFRYGGFNQLFEGGLLIGYSPAKLVDAVRNDAGIEDQDFTPQQVYALRMPGVISDQDGGTVFSDSNAASVNRVGVHVDMSSYAYGSAPDKDYVIVRYDIRNVSGGTLSNLYAGLYFDWDMVDPGSVDATYYAHNRTWFDTSRSLGYAWYDTNAPTVYCGVRALEGAGGYAGLIRDSVTGTRDEKWTWLSGGIKLTAATNDIHFVVSSGPYTLGDGGMQTVAFALAGGIGLSALQTNADAALQKWNHIKALQGVRPKLAIAVHQNPAFSRYADLYVTSDTPLAAIPTMTVRAGTGAADSVALVQGSVDLFRGSYEFSGSGTYTINVAAQALNGLDTVATKSFPVLFLKRGLAGTLSDPGKQAVLDVPAGTLGEDTYFTMSSDPAVATIPRLIGPVYAFGPEREFSGALTITLRYPPTAVKAGNERYLHVYRELGSQWMPLKTWADPQTGSLTATVTSLGIFGIGYDEHSSSPAVPSTYRLEQNFPNPFNPQTVIRFGLPEDGRVLLRVFDLTGREVGRLADDERAAGFYQVVWEGTARGSRPLASGIYFCSLEVYREGALKFSRTEKMALIR